MAAQLPSKAKPKHDERRRSFLLRRLWRDRKAASIIEFGLLTPIFFGVLGASVDLGEAVLTKFKLSSTLEAASSYALDQVQIANKNQTTPPASSAGAAALASSLAQLAANAIGSNWANVTVVVNNGPTTRISGGTATNSGTASNADNYYCPTGSGASMDWNSPQTTAGVACSGGGVAGKFVRITVRRAYSPILLPSPMVAQDLSATSIIQVQ